MQEDLNPLQIQTIKFKSPEIGASLTSETAHHATSLSRGPLANRSLAGSSKIRLEEPSQINHYLRAAQMR